MFPLIDKIQQGYKFGQWTFYLTKHRGTDYKAYYDSFYIPFPGKVEHFEEKGGGQWLRLIRDNGDIIEMAHLAQRLVPASTYTRAGDNGGITGNSGIFTTNPHFHVQVKVKGQYIDPEKYNWEPQATFPLQLNVKILINKMDWNATLLSKMAQLQDWFWQASKQRVQLHIDYKYVSLSGWETGFYGDSPRVEAITQRWYEQNVMTHAPGADIVLLVISPKDWHGQVFDDPTLVELGYCHNLWHPLKATVFCDEHTTNPFNPTVDTFVDIARHEIGHGLYGLGQLYSIDRTHLHFFNRQFEKMFDDINYNLLALNTKKI